MVILYPSCNNIFFMWCSKLIRLHLSKIQHTRNGNLEMLFRFKEDHFEMTRHLHSVPDETHPSQNHETVVNTLLTIWSVTRIPVYHRQKLFGNHWVLVISKKAVCCYKCMLKQLYFMVNSNYPSNWWYIFLIK